MLRNMDFWQTNLKEQRLTDVKQKALSSQRPKDRPHDFPARGPGRRLTL